MGKRGFRPLKKPWFWKEPRFLRPGCSIIRASLTVALMVSLPRSGSLCHLRWQVPTGHTLSFAPSDARNAHEICCGIRLWGSAPNPGRGMIPLHPALCQQPETRRNCFRRVCAHQKSPPRRLFRQNGKPWFIALAARVFRTDSDFIWRNASLQTSQNGFSDSLRTGCMGHSARQPVGKRYGSVSVSRWCARR